MKILYHHRTRSSDGQKVHIDGLIGALRRAGHEVLLVGPPPREEEAGARTSAAPRPWLRPLRELAELAYNRVEQRRLELALAPGGVDALYARHALFCVAPARVARRHGLPLLVEVNAPLAQERSRHGGLCLQRFARRQETRFLNQADGVITVTQVMKRLLVEQGVEGSRIEVHPNGVDPGRPPPDADAVERRRRELGLEGTTVLGFVGFVRDWNRLERVFPALARDPRRRLLVVGEGPDRARLEALARGQGVAGQLCFTGVVPADQVATLVALFDLALIPDTPVYASPLKLLDYLDAGRAVLAPDRENLREVLVDGGNARLFDPDRPGHLEDCLEALLADPAARRDLGAQARATIRERGLTWDHNAARVLQRLEALLHPVRPVEALS